MKGGFELYKYVHDPNGWIDVFGLSVESRSSDVIFRTGKEANATFPTDWSPPYKPNSKVTEFTTTKTETFVRVHGEGNKARSWLMNESGIRGLSAEQIRAKYSLPDTPIYVSKVIVPKGTRMRSGRVNPLSEFGGVNSNAKQFELLQKLPGENFTDTKRIKCH